MGSNNIIRGGKMKVGDLVQLSAYGEARQHNNCCWGGWGFVVEIGSIHSKYPIIAHWYKITGHEENNMRFHPRELKKYKPDKK